MYYLTYYKLSSNLQNMLELRKKKSDEFLELCVKYMYLERNIYFLKTVF